MLAPAAEPPPGLDARVGLAPAARHQRVHGFGEMEGELGVELSFRRG